MKETKSKKIYILFIIIIIIIIFALIWYISMHNKEQKKILTEEVNLMYSSKQVDTNTKTKGDYKSVELTIKSYYAKYLNTRSKLLELYSENTLSNALSAKNISEDGTEFKNTKEKIQNIKDTEIETLKKYEEIISDKYIEDEAKKENLSNMYTELTISLIHNNLNINEDFENLKSAINEYDKWLNNIETMIDFLSTNKDKWTIKENNIVFKSDSLVNEYNTLLEKVNENKEEITLKLEKLHKRYI